jgi:hypothetical protein
MQAFVLIQTQGGNEPLAAALRTIPGIQSADDLTGPFDAIAVVTADSTRDLFDGVVSRIRDLPGVTRALPAPVVRPLAEVVATAAAA